MLRFAQLTRPSVLGLLVSEDDGESWSGEAAVRDEGNGYAPATSRRSSPIVLEVATERTALPADDAPLSVLPGTSSCHPVLPAVY